MCDREREKEIEKRERLSFSLIIKQQAALISQLPLAQAAFISQLPSTQAALWKCYANVNFRMTPFIVMMVFVLLFDCKKLCQMTNLTVAYS